MKRKTILILGAVYVALIAVVLVVGLILPPWRPASSADDAPQTLGEALRQETSQSGLSTLGAKIESGAAPPSYQGIPGTPELLQTGTMQPTLEDGIAASFTPIPTWTNEAGGWLQPTRVTPGPTFARSSTSTGAPGTTPTRTGTTPNTAPTRTPTRTATLPGPTQTRTATRTRTPAPTNTPTSTRTPTATQTATPQTGWGGEWTVWFGPDGGPYDTGTLTVTLEGEQITASALVNGEDYTFTGQVLINELFAQGDYTSAGSQGWFFWTLVSESQFCGTLDNQFAFCASRKGGEQPDPCIYYLIS